MSENMRVLENRLQEQPLNNAVPNDLTRTRVSRSKQSKKENKYTETDRDGNTWNKTMQDVDGLTGQLNGIVITDVSSERTKSQHSRQHSPALAESSVNQIDFVD